MGGCKLKSASCRPGDLNFKTHTGYAFYTRIGQKNGKLYDACYAAVAPGSPTGMSGIPTTINWADFIERLRKGEQIPDVYQPHYKKIMSNPDCCGLLGLEMYGDALKVCGEPYRCAADSCAGCVAKERTSKSDVEKCVGKDFMPCHLESSCRWDGPQCVGGDQCHGKSKRDCSAPECSWGLDSSALGTPGATATTSSTSTASAKVRRPPTRLGGAHRLECAFVCAGDERP